MAAVDNNDEEAMIVSLSQTVTFNVGGKHYEVSKSLLQRYPDTVLAQKALKETGAASGPIFLDRDPDRFAYCLDFLRDNGNVNLPESVTRKAIVEELGFFGVSDIDESKIDDGSSRRQVARRFQTVLEIFHKDIATMEAEMSAIKKKVEMANLALRCFRESSKTTGLKIVTVSIEAEYNRYPAGLLKSSPHLSDPNHFNHCCEKLGLRHISSSFECKTHKLRMEKLQS